MKKILILLSIILSIGCKAQSIDTTKVLIAISNVENTGGDYVENDILFHVVQFNWNVCGCPYCPVQSDAYQCQINWNKPLLPEQITDSINAQLIPYLIQRYKYVIIK